MCRTEPEMATCVFTKNVELGNQGNETQIFAFKDTIDVLSERLLTENMLFNFIRYAEALELT